jgi:hypothetical protein
LRRCILIAILLLHTCLVHAQSDSTPSFQLNKKHAVIAGIVFQQATSSLVEYYWWWHDSGKPFNFYNDGWFDNYSLGMDKIGHAYTSYLCSHAVYQAMSWADFSPNQVKLGSIAVPAFWALSVEIGDAHSIHGFSWRDLLSNFTGIGLAQLQQHYPKLNAINFKFSYFPTSFYLNRGFSNWSFSNDYDGHIYWLSADVAKLNLGKFSAAWPEFLSLAVGYSTQNNRTVRQWNIGLEFNLNAWKPQSKGKQAIRNTLNYYHLPAPGLRYGNQQWQFQPLLLN